MRVQLRAFLGTVGYYRQFVPNYAHIASPLHRACQKGDRFKWTAECEETFRDIKHRLSSAPILAFPQLDVPFILDSDASDSGLGAVLSQVQCGKERVIAYTARALSKAKGTIVPPGRNCWPSCGERSTSRHSFTGDVFWSGLTIVLCSVYRTLKTLEARWLGGLKGLVTLISRWNIVRVHGNVDGLSCPPWDEGASVKVERDATLIQSVIIEPLSKESIRAARNQDPVLSQVVRWLETGVRPARGDVERGGANCYYTGHNGEDCFSGTVWCFDVGNMK